MMCIEAVPLMLCSQTEKTSYINGEFDIFFFFLCKLEKYNFMRNEQKVKINHKNTIQIANKNQNSFKIIRNRYHDTRIKPKCIAKSSFTLQSHTTHISSEEATQKIPVERNVC